MNVDIAALRVSGVVAAKRKSLQLGLAELAAIAALIKLIITTCQAFKNDPASVIKQSTKPGWFLYWRIQLMTKKAYKQAGLVYNDDIVDSLFETTANAKVYEIMSLAESV